LDMKGVNKNILVEKKIKGSIYFTLCTPISNSIFSFS